MRLPASVREIADVIGDERALYLVGQLPKCYAKDARYPNAKSAHVIMYVPKSLKPNHPLVKILGWVDASKLAAVFGGEILKPGSCIEIYRAFRDRSIVRMLTEGTPPKYIAEIMGMCERSVRNLMREIPQEAVTAANDNNAQNTNAHRAAS